MLHSDWLSYYDGICYSPLEVKSAGHICNVLAAKKDKSLALTRERCFVSSFFFYQLVGRPRDSEPIWASGIIVDYFF